MIQIDLYVPLPCMSVPNRIMTDIDISDVTDVSRVKK